MPGVASKTKAWFEVMLRRQQDWKPNHVGEVVEECYQTADFFADAREFDDDMFQLMCFVTDSVAALPRPMDMFDLLHACVTRPGVRGRVLAAKTFIVVPSHVAKCFKTAGKAAYTSRDYPDITIMELPAPWAVSGRLEGYKLP
jgi:hypothetical protein